MKTTDARHLSPSAQAALRERVVLYLKEKKKDSTHTQAQAAALFGLSLIAVKKIWKKYKEEGVRGISEKKRGVKGGKKLTSQQARDIKKLIKNRMPEQLQLPFGLWTRQAVADYLQREYGISLSRWQVGRYLKSWGYTPQKPVIKACEQQPQRVKQWLQEEYPEIKKQAKQEDAVIYWGDETGMRSDHQAGKTYAPKGNTPVIKKTGQRFSINMISALSNRGHLQFMIVERGTINTEVFIDFMKRLVRHTPHKVYLIVGGHPIHKTKKVQQWLGDNQQKLSLFYQPPYSPELNPDEYLDQDIKTNAIGRNRPENKLQMANTVRGFMLMRKKDKRQVKKYFHAKHVRYAA